jgi:hypothetical protein
MFKKQIRSNISVPPPILPWVQENTTYSIVNLETWQVTWINTSIMLIFVCILCYYVYLVKSSWELVFIVIQKPNSNKVFLSYLILFLSHLSDGSGCPCGDDVEDNFHYFYVCPLFICQRILLLSVGVKRPTRFIWTSPCLFTSSTHDTHSWIFIDIIRYLYHTRIFLFWKEKVWNL